MKTIGLRDTKDLSSNSGLISEPDCEKSPEVTTNISRSYEQAVRGVRYRRKADVVPLTRDLTVTTTISAGSVEVLTSTSIFVSGNNSSSPTHPPKVNVT